MVYYTPFSFGYTRKMLGNLVTSREHFWFGCEGNGIPLPPPGGHCDCLFQQSIRVFLFKSSIFTTI